MTGSTSFDLSRRTLLVSSLASLALPARSSNHAPSDLIAGTYANEGGLGLYRFKQEAAHWTADSPIASIRNTSFGVKASRRDLWYLLDETQQGRLGVYDTKFHPLAVRLTQGDDPCHAALSPDETAIAVANYSSGNIAFWQLDSCTGLPLGEAQLVKHEGKGPNAERQAGAHAHWVGFSADARWLHAVDLGADAIFVHRVDAKSKGLGETRIAYRAPTGSGPRHLARHPRKPVAYLVTELANSLIVLDAQTDGTFRARAMSSTLPTSFRSPSNAAHIALNSAGTRLYVSNRGHNSIAVFAVAPDGGVELRQHANCGGDWPRFFLLLEERNEMLVANERSGTVARIPVNRNGLLGQPSPSIEASGVAFLAR